MKLMKKFLSLLCVGAMTMGLLAGCGNSGSEEASSEGPKTFTMAVNYIPEALHPAMVQGGGDDLTTITSPLYDNLYYTVAGEKIYRLAENVELSADGLTYTVKLNQDAVWSDGEPITTEDVIFTVNYYTANNLTSYTLLNGEEVVFNVVDDKTFEVILPFAYGEYTHTLSGLKPMPAHVFDNDITKVAESGYFSSPEMVTSGAYTVSAINEDSLVYVKRDNYYRGTANVDQVVMKLVGEGSTAQIAFENNEISYMRVTSEADLNKYSADTENYNVYSVSEARTNYLRVNPYSPNITTPEAKEAIMLALNNQEIVEGVWGGETFATPANSDFNPDQTAWSESLKGYEQDIEKAKALAESSGLTEKTLKYVYNADRSGMEGVATIVQQQLAAIGVTVEVEGMDNETFTSYHAAAFFQNGNEDKWDLCTNGYDSMRGDYSYQISASAINLQILDGWSDEARNIALEFVATVNEEDMIAKGAELHDQLMAECMHYPVSYTNYVMVSHKNVTGLDNTIIPEFTDWLAINVE